jgi:hypothetical protein
VQLISTLYIPNAEREANNRAREYVIPKSISHPPGRRLFKFISILPLRKVYSYITIHQ